MEYDVFICHASEDKADFVKPLVDRIVKEGLKVWYDKFELTIGDSLREKIDYGLANSRYGVVVLSKAFFEKRWPQEELDGLVARQNAEGKKVILPIWHRISFEEVKKFSPILSGKLAAKSEEGLESVTAQVVAVCREEPQSKHESVFQTDDRANLRAKCLQIIREDNIIAWRQLVQTLADETIEKLLDWKQVGEKASSATSDYDTVWTDAVFEAVKISVPGLIPIFAAMVANEKNYWREATAVLRQLALLYNDMGGGTVRVLRIGDTVLYIAGSIGMALAAKTNQRNYVHLWAVQKLPESESAGERIWYETPEINYWETGVTGQDSDPYGFITRLVELDDIRAFFNEEKSFQLCLFMGNFLLSLHEFRNWACDPGRIKEIESPHWRPNVMPIWCLMKPNDFKREIWKLFGSSDEIISYAYPPYNVGDGDKFWPLWQAWKVKCASFMTDGGRYFRRGFNIRFLNLPGEPPLKS